MSYSANSIGKITFLLAVVFVAIITAGAGYATDSELGYLSSQTLPNSLVLLPPPPASCSTAFSLDEEYSKKSFALRDTPAWKLAASDADLTFPHAAETFSCALDAPITEKDTPHLYRLLYLSMQDAGHATAAAKSQYKRPRPFMLNKEPICSPEAKASLETNGSYPSGHNAIGAAWALILTEISPKQTDAIIARGQVFGLSRIVCNVHWFSDTIQGRYIGAAVVAQLHADPEFHKDLEAASKELEAVRAKGLKPTRDCDAETKAIYWQQSLLQ